MNIWLITVGEPLPIDQSNSRLLRTGLLAELLVERGHQVVWWTSTFDHTGKKHRFTSDATRILNDRCRLKLLHSISYAKNVSIRRILNHIGIARKFEKQAEHEPRPDVILCSFPTIELSMAAINYGRKHLTPVVVDVRDLWPDFFVDMIPSKLKYIGKILLSPFFKMTKKIFYEATSITAVSKGYLDWGLSYAERLSGEYDFVFPLGYKKPVASEDEIKTASHYFEEIGIDSTKTICLFIGTFGKTYDIKPIINAARYLEGSGRTNVQFVLCGSGEYYAQWRKLAEGLRTVIFTGWVNSPQLAYLMSIGEIGFMSYSGGAPQGLPNKMFEYLAAGLPILSSLQGEAAYLLKSTNCGLSYSSSESNGFIQALLLLLNDDDLRKKMSLNAQTQYENNYTATAVYSRMADLLEKIHRTHGAASSA